jgi:hypothetical protein
MALQIRLKFIIQKALDMALVAVVVELELAQV